MTTLFLDLETYSATPIKNGAHAYAEEAEVLLVALAVDDDPVQVWDTSDPEGRGSQLASLQHMIDIADEIVIHNSAFDRTVLRHRGVNIPVEKVTDTMVLALMHSLPASLGQLGEALQVPVDKAKDKDGKKLIQLFTKPRPSNHKLRRATRETHPDEWNRFIEYARADVDAMRYISGRLPRWNASRVERDLWILDQRINDRGVAVDRDFARSALRAFERASRSLAAATSLLTNGTLGKATQRDRVIDFMAGQGVGTVDLTKATVEKLLRDDTLPPDVRDLLEIRQQAAATSPSKYKTLIAAASSDGRLRGTVQFCGASRTGRDAGRLFQPQNLPRTPDWFDDEVQDFTIRAIKADCEDLIWHNVSERCSMSVRGCLVAEPGNKLVIADLSNIEGRVLAWLAGEDWKIEAFKAYDRGEGPDLYKVTAGRILGKEAKDVTKDERQSPGKVSELACLGPHTRVITNTGVKLITEVTTEDMLWDGLEWVRHTGLVARGQRQVLNVCGLELTADHQVLVGETWLQAQTVASCPSFLDQALATGSESLKSLGSISGLAEGYAPFWSSALAELDPTEPTSTISGGGRQLGATVALRRKLDAGQRRGFATPTSARTTRIADACATASRLASIVAITPETGATTITGGAASTSTAHGDLIEPLFSRILSHWMGGIDLNLNLTELMSTGVTSRVISVSSDGEPIVTTCDVFETCSNASKNLRPVYDIANAGPRNRFTVITDDGALIVHNCGFGGSVGAFRKMGGRAVEAMSDDHISGIVQGWRKVHPATRSFWYNVEGAARDAIRDPEGTFSVRGLVHFDSIMGPDEARYIRCRLPSGRYLSYRSMHVTEDGVLLYEGLNQYTRKWEWLETYYGKLVENIVQAVARDVFMVGLRRAEGAGYGVVLRVHDELVCEVPNSPAFTHTALAAMMSENPSWSLGLPLAAAGFQTLRYRKE